MIDLLGNDQSKEPLRYLFLWLGVVGAAVGLTLPMEMVAGSL